MSDASATLRAAIAHLYAGTPQQQQQANEWLNTFSKQPEAWSTALDLLDPQQSPECSFFCANLLLTKVRAEWHKLSDEQRAHISNTASNKFLQLLQHPGQRQAMQRLGLLLAAVAALSGAQACQAFAGQCLGMVFGGEGQPLHLQECACSMLTALAEEMHNMDSRQRRALVEATHTTWDQLVAAAVAAVPQHLAAGNYGLVHGALLCLQAWVKLPLDPALWNNCRATPGQMYAAQPRLFQLLFQVLALPGMVEEPYTCERLADIAAELLVDVLGSSVESENPQAEAAALEAIMGSLVNLRGGLQSSETSGLIAKAVATVAAAVAQRDADAVCSSSSSSPTAGALAETVLECLRSQQQQPAQQRKVCEAAADYFLAINTVPLAERSPALGPPLFSALAGPLFQAACHPPGWSDWDECDDDEEAFHLFREQALSELLESVYGMMGLSFLASLRDTLSSATSWEAVEGALYCLLAVRNVVRTRLSSSDPTVSHQTHEVLLAIFGDLVSGTSRTAACLLASPPTCTTAAQLIGAYASWFDSHANAPLEGALQLLLHALKYPGSWGQAAVAFRALCMRCSGRLAVAPIVQHLTDLAAPTVAPAPPSNAVAVTAPMPYEARCAVFEGLARLASSLSIPEAAAAAGRLLQPLLARCQSLLAFITSNSSSNGHGPAAGGAAAAVRSPGQHSSPQQLLAQQQLKQALLDLSDELRLVAVLIKGMEFANQIPPGVQHPVLQLLEAAWPLLQAAAAAGQCRELVVVEALCDVFNRALQQARSGAKPLLPLLLPSLLGLYRSTLAPCCLDTLAVIMETFGEVQGNPDLAAAQQQALTGVVSCTGEVLAARAAAGQQLSASGDLLRGCLAVVDAYLTFARGMLLSSPTVPVALDWAVAAAGLREKEPVSASLGFLSHLLGAKAKARGLGGHSPGAAGAAAAAAAAMAARAGGHANGGAAPAAAAAAGNGDTDDCGAAALQSVVAPKLEGLVSVLVLALCDTAPRQLLRALSNVLHLLLSSPVWRGPAAACLLRCLQSPELPGVASGRLKPPDAEAFARLLLQEPMLPRGRFDALVCDFAGIPRGEATSDVLMAYDLPTAATPGR